MANIRQNFKKHSTQHVSLNITVKHSNMQNAYYRLSKKGL